MDLLKFANIMPKVTEAQRYEVPEEAFDIKRVSSPKVGDKDEIEDIVSFRRGKVEELMRLGYDIRRISAILAKGVVIGDEKNPKSVTFPCDEPTIKTDIKVIKGQWLAQDDGYLEKRISIIDRYHYLYQRAMGDYLEQKGKIRATFLNTAVNITSKLAELEGVQRKGGSDEPPPSSVAIDSSAREAADEVRSLPKEMQDELKQRVQEILGQTKERGRTE